MGALGFDPVRPFVFMRYVNTGNKGAKHMLTAMLIIGVFALILGVGLAILAETQKEVGDTPYDDDVEEDDGIGE